ncbi:MAG: UxaA family hydrolase [Asticcacaulis sp.]
MSTNELPRHGRGTTPRVGAPAIVLFPTDNVLVCRRNVAAGEVIEMEDGAITVRGDIALGHKIARWFIPAGTEILKYGMPIGSTTADVQAGEWVHLHNLKSNYISTHTRQSETRS